MRSKLIILLTLILVTGVYVSAQTEPKVSTPSKVVDAKLPSVKSILERHLKAVGGRKRVMAIKTMHSKGTVELAPMGIKGTFETIAAAPDKSLTKMNLSGIGEFVEGYDGKIAWGTNPIQGMREKTGEELLQTKLSSNLYRDANFDKLYSNLAVKGIEKVNGKDAYVVTGTAPGLPEPTTFYFDVASGMMVRTDLVAVSPEGRQPVKTIIEESKLVEGVMMPSRIRTTLPTGELIMVITEVKTGVPVTDATFAKPTS